MRIISTTITTVECKTEPLPYTGESHLPHDPVVGTQGGVPGGMGYPEGIGGYNYYGGGGSDEVQSGQHPWMGYHNHQVQ